MKQWWLSMDAGQQFVFALLITFGMIVIIGTLSDLIVRVVEAVTKNKHGKK